MCCTGGKTTPSDTCKCLYVSYTFPVGAVSEILKRTNIE
jgi:hypothetical protein